MSPPETTNRVLPGTESAVEGNCVRLPPVVTSRLGAETLPSAMALLSRTAAAPEEARATEPKLLSARVNATEAAPLTTVAPVTVNAPLWVRFPPAVNVRAAATVLPSTRSLVSLMATELPGAPMASAEKSLTAWLRVTEPA